MAQGSMPSGARILVVDDEPAMRGFIADGLTRAGYQCSAVESASEAKAALARIHRRTPMDGVRKAEGGVRELQGK